MTTTLTVSEHPRQSATPRRGGPVVLVVAAGVAAVVARSTAPADSRMSGREVVVEGQLATGDTGRREIARIAVNCCAADARKYRVELSDAMGRLDGHEDGSWIRATVLLMPGTGTEARGFVPSVGVIDVGEVDDPGYEIWDV